MCRKYLEHLEVLEHFRRSENEEKKWKQKKHSRTFQALWRVESLWRVVLKQVEIENFREKNFWRSISDTSDKI